MKKNRLILIGGKLYSVAMGAADIEKDCQKRIDKRWGGSGYYTMHVRIDGKKVQVELVRQYIVDPYRFSSDEPDIHCFDSDHFLGNRLPENMILFDPMPVGYGYEYNYPVSEFYQLYKKNCKALKAVAPKNMKLTIDKKSAVFEFDM